MTPLHFTTNNRVLAAGLSMSGNTLLSVFNVYDQAALDRAECKNVKEARECGKPGVCTYVFEHTDELHAALAAWDEQHKVFQALNLKDRSDFIRVACVVLNALPFSEEMIRDGREFRDVWKRFPASFIVRKDGEPDSVKNADGSTTKTSPGFILAGEGLSEERARGIGL